MSIMKTGLKIIGLFIEITVYLVCGFGGGYLLYEYFATPVPAAVRLTPPLPLLNVHQVDERNVPFLNSRISLEEFKKVNNKSDSSSYVTLYAINFRGNVVVQYLKLGLDGVFYGVFDELTPHFPNPYRGAKIQKEGDTFVVFPERAFMFFVLAPSPWFVGILLFVLIHKILKEPATKEIL